MAIGTSLQEAFSDPEEREYAVVLARSDGDVAARRRYLAFLAAKGDPRAEPLRLYLLLTAPTEDDEPIPPASELRRALRARLPQLHAEWWRFVARPGEVYACGSADKADAPRVRFRFRCPNSWETLEPTTHSGRRFCTTCNEHVYWADDPVRIRKLARRGACISVPAVLVDEYRRAVTKTHTVMGQPDWPGMWASQFFDDDRK